jgi:GNAT superfamily N-acetyltransferase
MTGDDVRERFEQASRRHLTGELAAGVEMRPASADEYERHKTALWLGVGREAIDAAPLFSDEDRARYAALASLRGAQLEHRLLWTAGDQVVGSYWGFQEDYGRYYMINTVVHPDYQGRGLYSAFLPRLIAAVAEVGFREIYSRHRADNNAILVPKLKAGFVIAGFEIAPRFGMLVHLRLYLHRGLAQLFAHRIDGSGAAELRAGGVELP